MKIKYVALPCVLASLSKSGCDLDNWPEDWISCDMLPVLLQDTGNVHESCYQISYNHLVLL